jgi:hypothetical protein
MASGFMKHVAEDMFFYLKFSSRIKNQKHKMGGIKPTQTF